MRVFRIVLAGVLVLSAAVLAIGEAVLIFRHAQIHLLDHAVVFAFTLCVLATGFYCLRSQADWIARLPCPRCRRNGVLHLATFGQPQVSALAWVAGGFVGSLLYSYARKLRFHCNACGTSSRVRTIGGWLASAWLLCFILTIAVAIYVHGNT